jgi:hypothetical protein|tara:strand:+ start:1255 stop:2415 length:1161 start_codon:yes stop_codon:yes gene_type:complete
MSSLLKEAIVDAKALKEAALKNAEASIIEKYSLEVKDTLDKLLEQEALGAAMAPEMGMDPALDPMAEDPAVEGEASAEEVVSDEDVPLAAADDLPDDDASKEGEPVEFDLNLNALQEAIDELQTLQHNMDEDQELEISENDLYEILSEDEEDESTIVIEEEQEEVLYDFAEEASSERLDTLASEYSDEEQSAESLDETSDYNALVDSILEKLTVDMGAEIAGWAGRSSEDMKHEMEKEIAHRRSTDIEEELKDLKKAQEELVFENKQLKEQNEQYKQATNELKESLQDVNLSNARLLYTNRVLRNTSLNERQKDRIVEAISNAGSVTEARMVFDTLQSTAQATPKKSPQSLSEAITRRSSVIRASRQESTSSDPLQERMKRLAGIK